MIALVVIGVLAVACMVLVLLMLGLCKVAHDADEAERRYFDGSPRP